MKYDDIIVNIEEKTITLNMPLNYVIEKKGKKSVIIRIKKNED